MPISNNDIEKNSNGKKMNKLIIGNVEVCSLPDFGVNHLQVRTDTGAKTSSLHVDNLLCFKKDGQKFVEFELHPDIYHLEEIVKCQAPLKACRKIKSSNGDVEHRCVITTRLQLGSEIWPIELTLSNRQEMTYMMLLGRQGMADKVLVDPSQEFMLGR